MSNEAVSVYQIVKKAEKALNSTKNVWYFFQVYGIGAVVRGAATFYWIFYDAS